MANKKITHTRLANLSKGKAKKLGLLENLSQQLAGYLDGTRALPRESGDGGWTSPHIDEEIRAYEESASKIWGTLQIEEEEANVQLGELTDSVTAVRKQLEAAREELAAVSAREQEEQPVRKNGEERLTDAQVKARRVNERARRLEPLVKRINELQEAQETAAQEFRKLYSRVAEDENSTRMICNRLKDHTLQRLSVYWNAALKKHPKGSVMPAVPSIEITCQAEEVYKKLHTALLKKAEASGLMHPEEKEVA